MRSTQKWLTLALAAALPVVWNAPALGHGRNERNRNNPGRVDATTGNFRRAAVLEAAGADKQFGEVRPLARALAFSATDQGRILDRIAAYRQRGEEIALVSLHNETGIVKVVAVPRDRSVKPRVMGNKEIRRLGISPQSEVVPGLLSLVRSKELGSVPARSITRSSLSTSGLSYQGRGKTPAKWPAAYRKLGPNERAINEMYLSLPITAKRRNLSGAYITGWVTSEKVGK